jgi:hypothetical protein
VNKPTFKILGQEPAFFVGVVEAVLIGLLSFGVFTDLTQETIGVIVATVAAGLGLVTAYATKTTLYSALIGFAKAVAVLAVTFGAPLTDAQTSAAMALITMLAGAYLRERTASVDTAVSSASPGAVVPDAVVAEVPVV